MHLQERRAAGSGSDVESAADGGEPSCVKQESDLHIIQAMLKRFTADGSKLIDELNKFK